MLKLTLRKGDTVFIGEHVEMHVKACSNRQAECEFFAPDFVSINRKGYRPTTNVGNILHDQARDNSELLEEFGKCSCFNCLNSFNVREIISWRYDKESEKGTARCPFCGSPAVIPQQPIEILKALNEVYAQ